MRPVFVLLASAAFSACAGSAPAAEAPPVPPPVLPPAVVPPRPGPSPAVESEPPLAPPSAPRGTVVTRAYYEEADVTEWVLASGPTVLFRPIPTLGRIYGLAIVPGDSAETGPAEIRVPFDGPTPLDALTAAERTVAAGLFVLVGPSSPESVGAAAGVVLGRPRFGRQTTWAAPPPLTVPKTTTAHGSENRARVEVSARAPWEALGAAAVSASLVEERLILAELRDVRVTPVSDGLAGTVGLRIDATSATLGPPAIRDAVLAAVRALRATAGDVARGRSLATARVRRDAQTPSFWLDGLADLYRTTAEVRPSRDPATATPAALIGRIERVSERAVVDLAARLATAPPVVFLTGPDY